ncbi:ethanolamine utilization cob(I)yrinic acid a,c-diamide adenosyltransferase EutT [Silvimonas iriomotensis]|uniref:Ethanolamine utilization cobalamin adenosyltransferase n=1 Tax=Silvimonas iriomotensis TaxID=449662 RepID=A0ABQ2PB66_9NEIS|nr:ethanolamine utilization cob(I)yrinic acid a,c-diamide adenosyltransferase EutT [Silvimonas iriomotensis]GGP22528.1 ethanolamine utilization cobalamin adenosyltransferase [Silvimonas iriomotensis]
MPTFITEDWLRAHAGLGQNTRISLPADSRLTPAAQELIKARGLAVKFVDEAGRTFIENPGADGGLTPVHGLTGSATAQPQHCALCQQTVGKKTEALTHLNASTLVAKNDERIRFRGELDSAIALAVWVQTVFDPASERTRLAGYLADIRSGLGNVLRAEVTAEPMPEIAMGEVSAERLHTLSHQPLRTLGHDHIVPDATHGPAVAQLNLLRARIRECETCAAALYLDRDYQPVRPDILQALNRLSSAVYVLMILTLLHERGQPVPSLENPA